ncbi:MAG: NINE protein [Candidatus Moranbacteria bacterium]|nr:NINE protein [Candidatus Moranbacteria bacterium]
MENQPAAQPQNQEATPAKPKSEKAFVPAILLCFFLGSLGIHRFYVGKIGTGILMLVTLGGFGIWVLIDLVMIVTGNFKDAEGKYIKVEG